MKIEAKHREISKNCFDALLLTEMGAKKEKRDDLSL